MIEGFRHAGIVVRDLEKTQAFYLKLGFKTQSQAIGTGSFIESVTGIEDVNIKWIKKMVKRLRAGTEKSVKKLKTVWTLLLRNFEA